MEYKINDYECVFMVKENNEEARNALVMKYEKLVNKIARDYYNAYKIDENDLYQEGLIGLMNAVDSYKEKENAIFYTYACKCIHYRIRSYLRKYSNNKNKALSMAISLDKLIDDSESDYYNFCADTSSDPLYKVENAFTNNELILELKKTLTSLEWTIFKYRINGLSNNNIASVMNIDKRSVENAVSRIRQKAKKITISLE